MSSDINVLNLYKQFKGWTNGDKIDANSIILLVSELIPAVEKIASDSKGYYKKQVVLDTLKLLINDTNIEQEQKDLLNLLVETTIPKTIDTLISVAKGEVDIGKLKKTFCFCF